MSAETILVRRRLLDVLAGLRTRRLALVSAPPGSGKSILLRQFVDDLARAGVRTALAHAPGLDDGAVLAPLGQQLFGRPWQTIDESIADLEELATTSQRVVLVVDGGEQLGASEALERLVYELPPTAQLVVAGRTRPNWELTDLRMADELVEITFQDLCLRAPEVDALRRGSVVPGVDDAADIARVTDGWPIAVAMHQRGLLDEFPQYLTQNLLDELPAEVLEFAVRVSPLGLLSAPVCDDFLGVDDGTAALLGDLAAYGLTVDAGEGRWRLPRLMQLTLLQRLAESHCGTSVGCQFVRAGAVLERVGAAGDAAHAYARSGAVTDVARLVELSGGALRGDEWLELLSPREIATQPWLVLARARRELIALRWTDALESYRTAERSGPPPVAARARRERLALEPWLDPSAPHHSGLPGTILAAARGGPRRHRAAVVAADLESQLAAAAAALLAGDVADAVDLLGEVPSADGEHSVVLAAARLVSGVAGALADRPTSAVHLNDAADAFDALDLPLPAKLARVLLAASTDGGSHEANELVHAAARTGNPWAIGIAHLAGAAVALLDDVRGDDAAAAAACFRQVGAAVLEAWALAIECVGEHASDGRSVELASALDAARAAGAAGPLALVEIARARGEPSRAAEHLRRARSIADECGLEISRRGPWAPLFAATGGTPGLLVGREAELEAFDGHLERARRGQGVVIAVDGQAGIGRSRLVEEVATRAELHRMSVLAARCQADAPPYWPWAQVLRACAELPRMPPLEVLLGPKAGAVADAIAELRPLFGQPVLGPARSSTYRFDLLEAVITLLRRVTSDRPTLVVLDDLHLADDASAWLFEQASTQIHDLPLVLIATYRSDTVVSATLRRALSGPTSVERVTLLPLSPDAVIDVMARELGGAVPSALAQSIVASSGGVPSFVHESIRYVKVACDGQPLDELDIGSIPVARSMVDASLVGAGPTADASVREVVEVLAVLRRSADLGLLSSAVGRDRPTVMASLDAAVRAGVVTEHAPTWFGLAHPFACDALYTGMTMARRAELHGAIARVIDAGVTVTDDWPAEAAFHCLRAPDGADRGIELTLIAARRAIAQGQFGVATALCRDALDLVPAHRIEPTSRTDLLLTVGAALDGSGRGDEARAAFEAAARVALGAGDADRAGRAALGFADVWSELASVDRAAVSLLDQAASVRSCDGALSAILRARLATLLAGSPSPADRDRRERALVDALALTNVAGDPGAAAQCRSAQLAVAVHPGEAAARVSAAVAITDSADHAGNTSGVAARIDALANLLVLGDVVQFDLELGALDAVVADIPTNGMRWSAAVLHAARALLAGRLDDSEAWATDALAIRMASGDPRLMPTFAVQMLLIARERGEVDAVDRWLPALLHQVASAPAWRALGAFAASEAGAPERARVELAHLVVDGALDMPADLAFPMGCVFLSWVVEAVREPAAAEVLRDALRPWDGEFATVPGGAGVLCSISSALGLLALLCRDFDEAVAALTRGLEQERQAGMVTPALRTQLTLADALAQRANAGDAERARRLTAQAASAATDLGLPDVGRRASALMAGRASEGALVIRCFGGFRIETRGTRVPISGLKRRPLDVLRLLSARPGRALHREELVDAFWPDTDPRAATQNLQVAVSAIRQLLRRPPFAGAVSLERAGDAYSLRAEAGVDFDVAVVDSALAAADRARNAPDPLELEDALRRAVDAYGGDLLAGLDADWAGRERDYWRSRIGAASQELVELLLDRGQVADAVVYAERGVAADRHRDGLWRALEEALEATGNSAAAARARARYDEVVANLAR